MPEDRLDKLDYYTLLGLTASCTPADVRAAFRQFARRYHPDRFAGAPEAKRVRATEIYRRGAEGVQVLCDPAARRLYDAALRQGILRLTADQRDRATRAGEQKAKPRAATIRSPQAKAFHDRALAAWKEGRHRDAWRALQQADALEPGNPIIRERMRELEAIVRRWG